MKVTAAFLEGVVGQLGDFARRLDDSAAATAAALADASAGLDGLAAAWDGPRPSSVHGLTVAYLRETESVPAAITSAGETVRRWSAAAAEHAAELAGAEARADLLSIAAARPDATSEVRLDLSLAIRDVAEVQASWRRVCTTLGRLAV